MLPIVVDVNVGEEGGQLRAVLCQGPPHNQTEHLTLYSPANAQQHYLLLYLLLCARKGMHTSITYLHFVLLLCRHVHW
jgi:hypothetical protein